MSAAAERVTELTPRSTQSQGLARLSPSEIRTRVNVIQEVMSAVMKRDVHYGVIPGCKKPSLYKPGSEVLLATFQIATTIQVTDLSTDDCVRYQVRVVGTHQQTGTVLGEGIGECSSNEEKYKWRKAYDDEWNATPENRRRIKFGKFKDKQVRTEPADVANTILKMAKKRAQVDMTLTVTGASDCFDQDIEDLPDHLRPADGNAGSDGAASSAPTPQAKPAYTEGKFNENFDTWQQMVDDGRKTAADILKMLESKFTVSQEQRARINSLGKAPEATQTEGNADAHA